MEDSESRVRFGPFTLDVHAMELRKFDHRIRLRPQALTLLIHLVTRAGDLVTREELRGRLWGEDTFVDFEHGLNFCIRQIRRALGESAASPRFIETVPRRGYRFLSPSSRIRSLAVLPFDNLYDWQPVAAQTYCHRATKLSPSSSAGRRWQACCFMALGRYDESVAAATEALELDPLSPLAHILKSTAHYFGRRYDLALAEANKALEFDPHHAESHRFKGITLLQLDELEKAIPELETALRLMGEGPATLGSLGRAYARAGRLWFGAELRLQLATQWGF